MPMQITAEEQKEAQRIIDQQPNVQQTNVQQTNVQ